MELTVTLTFVVNQAAWATEYDLTPQQVPTHIANQFTDAMPALPARIVEAWPVLNGLATITATDLHPTQTLTPSPPIGAHRPGTRVVDEINHGPITFAGRQYHVVEVVWNGGGRSFDVYDDATGDDLTSNGSLDTLPTDDDMANLYECWHEKRQETDWHCPGGCGFTVASSQADQITDHVRDCDLVDGAGTPLTHG